MHREVYWLERYAPPEPGMTLVDEVAVCGGRRVLFVWRPRRDGPQRCVCCWSEPEAGPWITG